MLILALLIAHGIAPDDVDLSAGWRAGIPVVVMTQRIPGKDGDGNPNRLQRDAADAYLDLVEAAVKDGFDLELNFSFRDMSQQRHQYHVNRRLAAKPGYSNHQNGTAIDIQGLRKKGKKTAFYWWLIKNAGQFGWRSTIRTEPWHFEYTMMATGIS